MTNIKCSFDKSTSVQQIDRSSIQENLTIKPSCDKIVRTERTSCDSSYKMHDVLYTLTSECIKVHCINKYQVSSPVHDSHLQNIPSNILQNERLLMLIAFKDNIQYLKRSDHLSAFEANIYETFHGMRFGWMKEY